MSCLRYAEQIWSDVWLEKLARNGTYQKHNIASHEARSRNVLDGSVTYDATRWWNHGEEGRKDRFRLLQLVELDECVEKRDSDENTTKICVLCVILRRGNVDKCKI